MKVFSVLSHHHPAFVFVYVVDKRISEEKNAQRLLIEGILVEVK